MELPQRGNHGSQNPHAKVGGWSASGLQSPNMGVEGMGFVLVEENLGQDQALILQAIR